METTGVGATEGLFAAFALLDCAAAIPGMRKNAIRPQTAARIGSARLSSIIRGLCRYGFNDGTLSTLYPEVNPVLPPSGASSSARRRRPLGRNGPAWITI